MYKKFKQLNPDNIEIEHIMLESTTSNTICFPNVESNDGPERKAYLAWVAEGNVAEEWNQ
jgi:hypothetical protein